MAAPTTAAPDPTSATTIPHLVGILLDTEGVALTQVVVVNRTTGDRLIGATDADKRVIFDLANFTSGYTDGDIIDFQNVGASVGKATITVDAKSKQFQSSELDAAAASTVAITL